jgi:hydroxylamine dehydrogenase
VALQLKELGFKDVHCLKGGYREWVKAQWPVENKGTEPKKECVTCHMDVTPAIVEDWKLSRHAKQEVTCAVCHGDHHTSAIDTEQTMPVHPDRCGMCHQTQSEQFKKGKHARAWDVMKALPSAHRMPTGLTEGTKGCGGCHRIGYKTEAAIKELKESGAGFGYVSCDVCHTRHTFSKKEAQQPQACRTCHMGFDHAQWEMYSSSKHGVRFDLRQRGVLPETASAPSCQTCHMPYGDHGVKTATGYLAVWLPMPEDAGWAASRTTILQALGVLDLKGKPTPRFELVKKYDMARLTYDDWLTERVKMTKVCNTCHSLNFVGAELEKGDQMIRQADHLLAMAIRIVAGLYKDGYLKKPKEYEYPFPDFLALHDAPTAIEQKLWIMFMEHRMRAFQGAFHANPDFAFWYGWSQMQQDLVAIKEMAKEIREKPLRRKR